MYLAADQPGLKLIANFCRGQQVGSVNKRNIFGCELKPIPPISHLFERGGQLISIQFEASLQSFARHRFPVANINQQVIRDILELFAGVDYIPKLLHSPACKEKSTTGAECVIAPTEMKSTPVDAIAATVSSETFPEASNLIEGSRLRATCTNCRSESTV